MNFNADSTLRELIAAGMPINGVRQFDEATAAAILDAYGFNADPDVQSLDQWAAAQTPPIPLTDRARHVLAVVRTCPAALAGFNKSNAEAGIGPLAALPAPALQVEFEPLKEWAERTLRRAHGGALLLLPKSLPPAADSSDSHAGSRDEN